MPMNIWSLSYLHSLVDLHNQISLGKGDDQEADDIRDGMDVPCRKMSENDTDITSMISVLLYLLDGQDKEPTPRMAAHDEAWKLLVKFVSDSKPEYLEEAVRLLDDLPPEGPENNEERVKLIGKKHAGGLSDVEEGRLKELQCEADIYVKEKHLMPMIGPLDVPVDVPEVTLGRVSVGSEGTFPIVDLLLLAKHAESRAYARRLVNGGGVSIQFEGLCLKVARASQWVQVKTGMILKTGKRKFARIVVEDSDAGDAGELP